MSRDQYILLDHRWLFFYSEFKTSCLQYGPQTMSPKCTQVSIPGEEGKNLIEGEPLACMWCFDGQGNSLKVAKAH